MEKVQQGVFTFTASSVYGTARGDSKSSSHLFVEPEEDENVDAENDKLFVRLYRAF